MSAHKTVANCDNCIEEASGIRTFEGMTMKSLKLITDALPPPALAGLPAGAALAGLAEDADASF
jgi:hypothetical protein